jgi:hypothetical protein
LTYGNHEYRIETGAACASPDYINDGYVVGLNRSTAFNLFLVKTQPD